MIAAVVVAMTIPVAFTVSGIVPVLETDEIGERKAIVAADKVDARCRRAARLFEDIGRATKASCQPGAAS